MRNNCSRWREFQGHSLGPERDGDCYGETGLATGHQNAGSKLNTRGQSSVNCRRARPRSNAPPGIFRRRSEGEHSFIFVPIMAGLLEETSSSGGVRGHHHQLARMGDCRLMVVGGQYDMQGPKTWDLPPLTCAGEVRQWPGRPRSQLLTTHHLAGPATHELLLLLGRMHLSTP